MGVVIRRVLCLDLPTAGLVIGYLGIFGGIWQLIEILMSMIYFDEYYSEKDTKQPLHSDHKSITLIVIALLLVVCVVDLVSSILLIRGTDKKSHKMILPWLIIKGIALIILIPAVSLGILVGIYCLLTGQGSIIFVNAVLVLIVLVLYSYIFMVIYSLYHFIREEPQNPLRIDSEALYYNVNMHNNKI